MLQPVPTHACCVDESTYSYSSKAHLRSTGMTEQGLSHALANKGCASVSSTTLDQGSWKALRQQTDCKSLKNARDIV